MATDRQKIIEKIQALLNMTVERGATENEAMVAASKAAELLLRYNIERHEVEQRTGSQGEPITEEAWEADQITNGWWALARGCSKTNFCSTFTRGRSYVFIGRESNAQVARYLFVYLSRVVNEAAEDAWAGEWLLAQFQVREDIKDFEKYNKRRWKGAFVEAACYRLHIRLLEAAGQVKADQPGLVVALDSEVARYLTRYKMGRSHTASAAYIGSAKAAGHRAGDSINWREGIGRPGANSPRLGPAS